MKLTRAPLQGGGKIIGHHLPAYSFPEATPPTLNVKLHDGSNRHKEGRATAVPEAYLCFRKDELWPSSESGCQLDLINHLNIKQVIQLW